MTSQTRFTNVQEVADFTIGQVEGVLTTLGKVPPHISHKELTRLVVSLKKRMGYPVVVASRPTQTTLICPACGETHYIHFAGYTQAREGAFRCGICEQVWLIPPIETPESEGRA